KMCIGCCDTYYCNTTCQTADWTRHIFACDPRRPINTADHLAVAVRDKRIPLDKQALNDWGLEKAMTTVSAQAARDLFAVYVELIEVIKIKPRRLHRWRLEGSLTKEIKAVYESLPQSKRNRNKNYQWFLRHQFIFDEPEFIDSPRTTEMTRDRMYRRLWVRLGHSPTSTPQEILDYVKSLPPSWHSSFEFYALCLEGCIPPTPSPVSPWYLEFGLGACRTLRDCADLMCSYGDLTDLTSFEEFHEAFSSGKLFHLFAAKSVGLQLDPTRADALRDILEGMPSIHKTVWDLQQFLAQDPYDRYPLPILSRVARMDYGYENC
ncbi:hypothetical protein BC629DRAFT_1254846, partial [Irpex lacteus]